MSRSRSTYNNKTAAMICNRLANGESLRSICRLEGMPSRQTVWAWQRANPGFLSQYEVAQREGLKCWADDLVSISDDETVDVNRAKLMIETRKWILCKLVPRQYGEGIILSPEPSKLLGSQREHGEIDPLKDSYSAWGAASEGRPVAVKKRLQDEDANQDLGQALREWKEQAGLTAKTAKGREDD